MDLIVNGPAVLASSRGVRRYVESVMRHLNWPDSVQILPPARWRWSERPRELLRRGRADAVFWTPCQRGPLRVRNHVVTVHDCINVEFVHRNDWRLPAYRILINAMLDGAEAVVAISNATKGAILRNYRIDESRIVVIASACDSLPQPIHSCPQRTPERPYILLITNALPHKNNRLACEALAASAKGVANLLLRVVGALPPDARAVCQRVGVRLEEHAYVDDALLASWYSGCMFLLSPSLAEGHNLPIAEALACGANVLCSDIPAHREFYEGKVRFFDPGRREAITAAIDAAIEDSGRWYPAASTAAARSFIDVARDYAALFRSIS